MITLGKVSGVDGDPMEVCFQKPTVESFNLNLKMTSVGLFVFRLGTRCVAFVTAAVQNVLAVAPLVGNKKQRGSLRSCSSPARDKILNPLGIQLMARL